MWSQTFINMNVVQMMSEENEISAKTDTCDNSSQCWMYLIEQKKLLLLDNREI